MILIRAFIGVEFESDCKKYIYELQQRLRKYAVKGRWKYSGNFHLTLKFLDEIDARQKIQVDEALQSICRNRDPFRLYISELGVFGYRDAIRVLWLGLAGDLKPLQSLAENIDRSLASVGFAAEKRPYAPHITLGQEIVFECPFDQILAGVGQVHYGPINVEKLTLFKSEQLQNKRVYSKISEYGFASQI